MRTSYIFSVLLFVLFIAGHLSAEPYVQVQDQKIKVSDLNRNAPPGFIKTNRFYNGDLMTILREAGHRRLLELEAGQKKLSYETYIKVLNKDIVAPTEKDIRKTYDILKMQGAVGGNTLERIREPIRRYILGFREKQALKHEVNRLKKKFKFRLVANKPEDYGVFIAGEPTLGKAGAAITLVKYGDFLCFFCRKFMGTQKALTKQYGKKIRFVFKDVPFKAASPDIHAASSCVWKLKPAVFWKYYYTLYGLKNSRKVLNEKWREAQALRLKVKKTEFRACLMDPAVKAEIKADRKEARTLGVRGTPTFFINGIKVSGAQSLDNFRSIIDELLER